MAKFWDRLLETKISFNDEIKFIEQLLNRSYYTGCNNSSLTIYRAIKNNFMSWQFRQNFISLEDCMNYTGINTIIDKSTSEITQSLKIPVGIVLPKSEVEKIIPPKCTIDEYLDYAEFLLNIMSVAVIDEPIQTACYPKGILYGNFTHYNGSTAHCFEPSEIVSIVENIKNTIEKANHTIVQTNKVFRIIPKDPVVLDVATKISEQTPKLTDDILLYGHRANSGNLKEKGAILARLHIYFEGELKKRLSTNGYTTLVSDIGFIANNVPDIRHSGSSKISVAIDKLPIEGKEAWFDKLFTLFLCAIELKEHSAINNGIAEIKKVEANA